MRYSRDPRYMHRSWLHLHPEFDMREFHRLCDIYADADQYADEHAHTHQYADADANVDAGAKRLLSIRPRFASM